MESEDRLELTDEIYGIIKGDMVEFTHEDTTVYPDKTEVRLDELQDTKIFNYVLTEDDISWITTISEQLISVD